MIRLVVNHTPQFMAQNNLWIPLNIDIYILF